MKKTCRKTTTEMGRQHQEGLLFAAEYKRIVEASEQGIPGDEILNRPGPDAGCRVLKKKKKV